MNEMTIQLGSNTRDKIMNEVMAWLSITLIALFIFLIFLNVERGFSDNGTNNKGGVFLADVNYTDLNWGLEFKDTDPTDEDEEEDDEEKHEEESRDWQN